MRHQDLTLNHRLESYVYATAAARTGASGFVPGDLGRIAYQQDNGTYWRLTATTPAWSVITSGTVWFQTALVTPAGTTSTVGVMAGIALSNGSVITPLKSGLLCVTASGSLTNNDPTGGAYVQLRYGTGTAPANGAALTGTAIGPIASRSVIGTAGYVPFSMGLVILLPVAVSYWFDLSQTAVTAGTASMANVGIASFELP
jgi:hypothetical protein